MSLLNRRLKTNVRQKNRIVRKHPKKNLIFGTNGIMLVRQLYIENIHFKFIRLILRKRRRNKKKRIKFGYQKYWIRFGKNVYYSKKSKNSRMGSGKGLFVRKATRIGINKTILEFKFYRYESLFGFLKVLRHKLKIFTRIVREKRILERLCHEGDVEQGINIQKKLIQY